MSSYGYILVTGLIVVGGFVTVSELSGNRSGNHELLGVHVKEEARDAAVQGLNVTIDRLMADDGPWLDPMDYQVEGTPHKRSSYASAVIAIGAGDTVDVSSVGTREFLDHNGDKTEATHTIEVRLVRFGDMGPIIADWSER